MTFARMKTAFIKLFTNRFSACCMPLMRTALLGTLMLGTATAQIEMLGGSSGPRVYGDETRSVDVRNYPRTSTLGSAPANSRYDQPITEVRTIPRDPYPEMPRVIRTSANDDINVVQDRRPRVQTDTNLRVVRDDRDEETRLRYQYEPMPSVRKSQKDDYWWRFKDHLEAGIHIGSVLWGDSEDIGLLYGFHVDYHFDRSYSLEFAYTTLNDTINANSFGVAGLPDQAVELDSTTFALTGKFNAWQRQRHNIYLGLGAGYSAFQTGSRELDDRLDAGGNTRFVDVDVDLENSFSYHGLVGWEYALNRNWEVYLELRQSFVNSTVDLNLVRASSNGNLFDTGAYKDISYDTGTLRGGFNYRW